MQCMFPQYIHSVYNHNVNIHILFLLFFVGHSPKNVLEMNSDTWLPDRLISERWVSSLFNILLNCWEINKQWEWFFFFKFRPILCKRQEKKWKIGQKNISFKVKMSCVDVLCNICAIVWNTPSENNCWTRHHFTSFFHGNLMDFYLSAMSLSVGRYATISRLSPPNNPKHMNPLTWLWMSGQNDLLGHARSTPHF